MAFVTPKAVQSFYMIAENAVRVEFHVTADDSGLTLDTLYNPPRDPDSARFDTPEDMAKAMGDRAADHLADHASRLIRIRARHDPAPITTAHLGQFGVPIYPE